MLSVDANRTIEDLRTLAQFGKFESGVNRRGFTPEDIGARAWLLERMQAAGLDASIDGVGNVTGKTPGCERYIIIGSHSDTVPKGGWLDGALGVIFALEIARAWVEAGGNAGTGVKAFSFSDEEGRFNGLFGSSIYSGLKSLEQVVDSVADDGTVLEDALRQAGYAGRPVAAFDPSRDVACIEAHIEQGPVLESNDRIIGIVTEIVGVGRSQVFFFGKAGHAGTVPMAMRQDAAAAAYDFAVMFAQFCHHHCSDSTVWNIGKLRLEPGAYNVTAREAEVFLEYRDTSADILTRINKAIPELAAEAGAKHKVGHKWIPGVNIPPERMDSNLAERLEAAAERCNAPRMRMPSGGGHDCMLFAKKVPTAMLFVPSLGGHSHVVAEDTREADIALGIEVMGEFVSDIIENGLPG